MTVKLSRYVFRKIGGRIVPIRKGADDVANFSMSALRKRQGTINKKLQKLVDKHVKDSVVKKVLFHGTDSKFAKFDHDFIGKNATASGRGFYFTKNKGEAMGYGKNVGEYYLNIKKPIVGSLNEGFKKEMKMSQFRKFISSFGSKKETWSNWLGWPESIPNAKKSFFESIKKYSKDDVDLINSPISDLHIGAKKTFENLRKTTGIDGIITGNKKTTHYIALNSDQIMRKPNFNKDYNKMLKHIKSRNK